MSVLAAGNSFKNSRLLALYGTLSFLFFLQLSQNISVVSFVLVILVWIRNKWWRNSFEQIGKQKMWWAFMAFYFFHIVSLLWTDNYKYAFFDLQIKLSYLLCPVVLSGIHFTSQDWKKIRMAFMAGATIAGLICLGHAFWQFSVTGKKEFFFHDRFSVLMHPSYYMMYLNISMLFLMYDLFWDREQEEKKRKIFAALLFFQLVILFLLSARTALAVALLSFLVYCIIMRRAKKLSRRDTLPVFLFFGFAVLFQIGVITFYNRYDQVTRLMEQPDSNEENSASVRYHLWKIASELIGEHPVAGVGIGDIKEELVAKYEQHKYEYGIRNRISPHNQYLHTAVILGISGVCLLVFMLLGSFVLAWKNKDWIFALFIMIIALNAVTESILERQAGVLFFAFFNSLFASRLIGINHNKD